MNDVAPRPTSFWPQLTRDNHGGWVWRHGSGPNALEHAYRGDPDDGDPRFQKFLDECWEATQHHANGRYDHPAIRHFRKSRHSGRPGLNRGNVPDPGSLLSREAPGVAAVRPDAWDEET